SLDVGETREAIRRRGRLTGVQLDGLDQGRCSAVVKIGSGIGNTPQRRRAPFAWGRRATVGVRLRFSIESTAAEPLSHLVQQKIAVDPLSLGQIGSVAVSAADLLEVLFARDRAGGLGR